MRIQLWSYNYAPEPTGIAPVSTALARALADRGHDVKVVAAHPHYPEPRWGRSVLPHRMEIDGIRVVRLPLWIGRKSAAARVRQDATFALSLLLASPFLGKPDAIIAVSPSFPALAPTVLHTRLRRIPWILWLQDILPDGAISTGIMKEGFSVRLARKLERRAYRSASRIVVISETFERNLQAKDVPSRKLTRVFNPSTRVPHRVRAPDASEPRVLVMGNIGHSQGLAEAVEEFENSEALAARGARFVITGTGVAESEVRSIIRSDRTEMLGLVDNERLEDELARASVGIVCQRSDFPEFNLPSQLMNYFAYSLPVVARVGRDSEVGRVVERTDAGWVAAADSPGEFASTLAGALDDQDELARRGERGAEFAESELSAEAIATQFEVLLRAVCRPATGAST